MNVRSVTKRAVRRAMARAINSRRASSEGRLTISGTGFLLGGAPWRPYGFSDGHFELGRTGDAAYMRSMYSTLVRIPVRLWGTYGTGHQQDMQEEGQPGGMKPAYLAELVVRLLANRAAGLRNFIAMDSDKGQGAEASADNYFSDTPEGNRKWAVAIATAVYLATYYGHLIDGFEPIVEPNSSIVASAAILQARQEEFMTAVLAVAPHMLFPIGPRDYAAGNIANAIKAAWLVPGNAFHGHVFMTCNSLDNLSMDPVQRASRIALVASTRDAAGVPAWINQLATHNSTDPDNTNLDATMTLCDEAANGPVFYNYWELVSMADTADGVDYLSNAGDPNSARLTHTARKAVITSHFQAMAA